MTGLNRKRKAGRKIFSLSAFSIKMNDCENEISKWLNNLQNKGWNHKKMQESIDELSFLLYNMKQ